MGARTPKIDEAPCSDERTQARGHPHTHTIRLRVQHLNSQRHRRTTQRNKTLVPIGTNLLLVDMVARFSPLRVHEAERSLDLASLCLAPFVSADLDLLVAAVPVLHVANLRQTTNMIKRRQKSTIDVENDSVKKELLCYLIVCIITLGSHRAYIVDEEGKLPEKAPQIPTNL